MCLLVFVIVYFNIVLLSVLSPFFFIDPATTEIYTLSLHDALPILEAGGVEALVLLVLRHEHLAALVARCSWRRTSRTRDRKSTRLNSSHEWISYAVFCLKKKKNKKKYNTNEDRQNTKENEKQTNDS